MDDLKLFVSEVTMEDAGHIILPMLGFAWFCIIVVLTA
jgi:hypothetical protein